MGSRGRGNKSGAGGYQAPARPAAVSGPGSMSARTDGGPAKPAQPAPDYSGHRYGQNQALNDQARSAPIAASPAPEMAPMSEPAPMLDPWRPTERPGEPVTAGAALGAGPTGPTARESAAEIVRVLYAQNPDDDDIRDLLEALDG